MSAEARRARATQGDQGTGIGKSANTTIKDVAATATVTVTGTDATAAAAVAVAATATKEEKIKNTSATAAAHRIATPGRTRNTRRTDETAHEAVTGVTSICDATEAGAVTGRELTKKVRASATGTA